MYFCLFICSLWSSAGNGRCMTNSSAICFCLLQLSSKWHSICLWCRWAFEGAFTLLLLFPSSCPPLYPTAANHVTGCAPSTWVCAAVMHPRCSCFLELSAAFHHSLQVSTQLIYSFSYRPISNAVNLYLSACVHVSAPKKAMLHTIHFVTLFFSCKSHFPVSSHFLLIKACFVMAILLHISFSQ